MTIPTYSLNNKTQIPSLGLGVWQIEDGQPTIQAVKAAIDSGYRLIDTAAVYGNEQGVGQAIAEFDIDRSDLFITTKLWNSHQGKELTRSAFDASLHKLGLDYVDLYLIHWPTPARDKYVETWHELESIYNEGKAKAIGVSNFHQEHIEKLLANSTVAPAVNQIELHPYFQQRELVEYCRAHDIQVESWSPLGGTGSKLLSDPVINELATRYGKNAAQIIIRWHIQKGFVVIPKSSHPDRIRQNGEVFDFELTDEDMSNIDNLDQNARKGPNPDTMNVS